MPYRAVLTILLVLGFLTACGGGGPQLDARVLQLSVAYAANGPTAASMAGGRGAATSGVEIDCRLTSGGKPIVGTTTANEFGAFTMPLDQTAFPDSPPTAAEFANYNDTIECRPSGGQWTHPLRQPQIRVE